MASIRAVWTRLRWALLLVDLFAAVNVPAQTMVAPALTLATVDGQKIRLSDLRGKTVLVNFWATSCEICLADLPQLIATYQHYHNRGLEVIAVAMPYDRDDLINKYIAKHQLPFPVVWDRAGDIGSSFQGVLGTPTTFIIDKNGRLISKTIGPIDFVKLRRFLDMQS